MTEWLCLFSAFDHQVLRNLPRSKWGAIFRAVWMVPAKVRCSACSLAICCHQTGTPRFGSRIYEQDYANFRGIWVTGPGQCPHWPHDQPRDFEPVPRASSSVPWTDVSDCWPHDRAGGPHAAREQTDTNILQSIDSSSHSWEFTSIVPWRTDSRRISNSGPQYLGSSSRHLTWSWFCGPANVAFNGKERGHRLGIMGAGVMRCLWHPQDLKVEFYSTFT